MLKRWAAVLALVLLSTAACADDVAEFYRGRQIQVIVGYGPGGGYDLYARLVARHMGRFIPGNPSLVVQNMPGAGSLRATNFIYNVAPKDGTLFGILARNMPLLGILGGNPAVQFDPRRFTWIGSSSSFEEDAYVLFLRPDAANKSIEDARRPGGPPLVLGGTGEGSTGADVPLILREALGLNIRQVTGYPDANALFLAIERGEIEGRVTDFSSVKANRPHWVAPGGMRLLLQFARRTRHPELPHVPTARELANDERGRALVEIAELPFYTGRPFAAPPGIPEDRAKALQEAFMAAHRDPQLIEEATRMKLGITPVPGTDFLPLIEKIAASPPELLELIRKLQEQNKS